MKIETDSRQEFKLFQSLQAENLAEFRVPFFVCTFLHSLYGPHVRRLPLEPFTRPDGSQCVPDDAWDTEKMGYLYDELVPRKYSLQLCVLSTPRTFACFLYM